MCSKISSLMTWHHDKRADDGMMRHPADSMAWKKFDELHPSFAVEPRNVRLGLASDGFQPFGMSRTPYSIWPVVLIPYNLPPWLCMKQENFILSMLIPGPESPGDAIDVYLQPLIEELKALWETGVESFDASTRKNFMLHASLLWTINDFPAYANLSGWSTKGKLACPCCSKDTFSIRLKNGKKQCYMGHRRFLPLNHKWRNDKESFDGTKERRLPPKILSGDDILDQVADLDGLLLTKDPKKKIKLSHEGRGDNWNKKSIFFDLPYWKTLLLRHNLDVMHIEKNICDNILGTILNIKGKTKDNLNTRLDLQEMNIREELHPIKTGDEYELPPACYTLSPEEKQKFFNFLKNLKVPDGFSSNISQCVNLKDRKISGLKSHDCHVILQYLLPLSIRGMLSKSVSEPLIELFLFFNVLGTKCLRADELEQIEAQIPITLCKLEKVFPPAFFDVMMHLTIHLANEAMIAGPIQYRWMYPIERYLHFLKSFIGNMACPEGSIAEGYLANECMTLCSRYLHTTETKFNRLERNDDGGVIESDGGLPIFYQPGRTLKGGTAGKLDLHEREQAHFYILKNCDEIQLFLEEFSQIPADTLKQSSDVEWNRQFISWLQEKVAGLYKHDDNKKMTDLLSLSRGPMPYVTTFKGYICNGYRFHVQDYDKGLRTQNCGVVVVGETDEEQKIFDYYGELTEVLELQFVGGRRVILFRCMWFDVYDQERGVKIDEYDFVDMNPVNFRKSAVGSSSKSSKHAYIPPGALAKGRGQSLRSLGSLRVTAQQMTPIGGSISHNADTSNKNELAKKSRLVPPSVDPIEEDLPCQEAEVMQEAQRGEISPCEFEKAKKVRGKNVCKNVLGLKPGEKLKVTFYQNRVVGKHQASFTRHLGLLVCDGNMCPLRVHSWADIEEYKLEHMWEAVIDKFESDDMNEHRGHVLKHMRKLWNNWRGSLHKSVKSKPLHEVLKSVPERVDKHDWEWLVKEHFLSDKFKEASTRNSVNRSKLSMPHRTGSKPIREIIYEMGGKDGKPPDMATIFFETRKKDDQLVEPETKNKYAEIKQLVQSEPSLSNIEVVERCFGPQCKSHAVGFGGGVTAKELKGGKSSKAALLDELKATRKEKESLQKRLERLETIVLGQQPSSSSSDHEFEA